MATFALAHRWAIAAAVVIAALVVVLVWFQPQQLFIDERVDDPIPRVTEEQLAETEGDGMEDADVEIVADTRLRPLGHAAAGKVLVLKLADGRRVLRFEDLDVENGPDLRVYLSADAAGGDYAREFVDLGALEGNLGNQNYAIPSRVDLARYSNAVIWCRRFSVGFAVAPLT